MVITSPKVYNRATTIGDLNGDGWLNLALGADKSTIPGCLDIPRNRLYIYQPAPSGRYEDGHYQDISGTDLVPGFPE